MTQLVEGLNDRMCRECYEIIVPTDDGKWEDDWESTDCLGGVNAGHPHALHDDAHPYKSHSHDGELSAVLEIIFMGGDHDDDFGDVDTFGHFALFRDCRSIMYTDSQGFVYHMTYNTPEECEKAWEVTYASWLVHEVEADLS